MGLGDATMIAGLKEYNHRRGSAWRKQCHCSISTPTVKGHDDIAFKITVSIKHNSHIKGVRYFILNWIWVPMIQEHGFLLPQIACPYIDMATWTLIITEQSKVINHSILKIHSWDNKVVGLLKSKEHCRVFMTSLDFRLLDSSGVKLMLSKGFTW